MKDETKERQKTARGNQEIWRKCACWEQSFQLDYWESCISIQDVKMLVAFSFFEDDAKMSCNIDEKSYELLIEWSLKIELNFIIFGPSRCIFGWIKWWMSNDWKEFLGKFKKS